jgi:hypothetical protein
MKANEPWARAAEGWHKYQRPLPSTPNILEQGNGYLNTEGAVHLARAISRQSDTLSVGTPWIANLPGIKAYSTIAGQGVLWGDGVLWGSGVLWGDNTWNDSTTMYKQPSSANGVLWGDGVLRGDHVTLEGSTIWQGKVGAYSLLSTTSNKWYPAFVDATSIGSTDADSVLIFGDAVCSLRIGPPGAWFYALR